MAATSPLRGNSSPAKSTSAATRRGQNKPKCIKCGNVARSRCLFQSCKSCCAKAENPCPIHVLKANAAVPDKTLTSGSTLFDQPSIEPSPSGTSHRIASLRQLSDSFAQFSNLQSSLRSRRPLTIKEAAVINEWRFKKLKEYEEGIIDLENEAFHRYMQNISLLEEVLAVNTKPEGPTNDVLPISYGNPTSAEDSNKMVLSALRLKLRSNPTRSENLRKRVLAIVDQGLKKLQKIHVNHGENELNKQIDLVTKDGIVKLWSAERESSMNDLLDRLSKARNEEDLKSCLEIKSHLFGRHGRKNPMQTEGTDMSNDEISENGARLQSDYSPPRWLSTSNVDQDALLRIDSPFFLPEGIESL